MPKLRDCFNTTVFELFEHEDIEQHASAVLGYIECSTASVMKEKRVRIRHDKGWWNSEVRQSHKEVKAAFKAEGKGEKYFTARANHKRAKEKAKREYKEKIEDCFQSKDHRQVWKGVQQLTNYKSSSRAAAEEDPQLAESLNSFYTRFELEEEPEPATLHPSANSKITFTVEEHEVRCLLKAVDPGKATGPDGVAGRVLKECADELAPVFTTLFNRCLSQATIPTCLKTSTIIPVPKKGSASCLNDYRPVALTPIIMKCFEKLLRKRILAFLPPGLDKHQFAYKANRSTEDAIAMALHPALSHIDKGGGGYTRMLFVDYSSAFNTIIPDRLVTKMSKLGIPDQLCLLVKSFLTDRPQTVRIGPHTSTALTLSTGSPQGCVLSPLLYSLYTHDFTPTHPGDNTIIKFADDTTIVGCISKGEESNYREEVAELSKLCKENNLLLNQTKTVEMVMDFRKKKEAEVQPLLINGDRVERVSTFRFLGVHLDDDLSWRSNTKAIIKKAQQRLFFLRKLRNLHLRKELLVSFYRCSVESILTYCINVWFQSCTGGERKALQRVVNTAQKIIGCPLPPLKELYGTRCLRKATKIYKDPHHPGNHLLKLMPSGRRFRQISTRTSRLRKSFYPKAIDVLNKK